MLKHYIAVFIISVICLHIKFEHLELDDSYNIYRWKDRNEKYQGLQAAFIDLATYQ